MTNVKITHLKAGAALTHLIDDILQKGSLHCDTQLIDDCVDAFAQHALETIKKHDRQAARRPRPQPSRR